MTRPRSHRLLIVLLAGALAPFAGGVRAIAAVDSDPFADVAPSSISELGDERAGFVTAAGVTFDFAETVETSIQGKLAFVSTLNLTPSGGLQQSSWMNPDLTNAVAISPSDAQSLSALTGLDARQLAAATGVVIRGDGGVTAALAAPGPGGLQNLVVNTANAQTVSQVTNLTITLSGFAAMQDGLLRAAFMQQIAGAAGAAQLSNFR